MNDLSNKIALITGATSGIGAATAKRFAQVGATVICTGRNQKRGESVVKEIVSLGLNASFYEMDINNDESIQYVADKVKDKYGRLDIIFNNAGVFPLLPPLEFLTRDDIKSVMDINVSGMLMVLKAFMPLMGKGGVVLNNASIAGMHSHTSGASYAYNASKSGVIKITQMMAKKYGSIIRFNTICPGVIRTPIFINFDEERYSASIPMGRVGEPEEVASVANFLVSDDARYVNGAIVTIDGGQTL